MGYGWSSDIEVVTSNVDFLKGDRLKFQGDHSLNSSTGLYVDNNQLFFGESNLSNLFDITGEISYAVPLVGYASDDPMTSNMNVMYLPGTNYDIFAIGSANVTSTTANMVISTNVKGEIGTSLYLNSVEVLFFQYGF